MESGEIIELMKETLTELAKHDPKKAGEIALKWLEVTQKALKEAIA